MSAESDFEAELGDLIHKHQAKLCLSDIISCLELQTMALKESGDGPDDANADH